MNDLKHGLPAQTVEQIRSLLASHPHVEKAILYGSRAKGNFKNGSDIDLSFLGKDLVLEDLMKIAGELDELPIPYKVDVSLFEQLNNAELKEHIERVGVVFYKCESIEEIKQPLNSSNEKLV